MKLNLNQVVFSTAAVSTAVVKLLGNLKKIVPHRRKPTHREEE